MNRLVVFAVLMALTPAVLAQDFKAGTDAFHRHDFTRALRELKPLAERGDAFSQNLLGVMYFNGHGVPKDYAEAANWYRKAADQGATAAQFNLGVMYDIGLGVPQDSAEAARWYRMAAERGVAVAQFNLGVMYDTGQGVPQDYVQAHKWYNLAAAQFPASEGQKRENALKNSNSIAAEMSSAQIAEARKLAREWMAEFAKRGGK